MCVIFVTLQNFCETTLMRSNFFVICGNSTTKLEQVGDIVMKSPVVKRSIVIDGRKTSVSLEDAFWEGVKEIAHKRRMRLSALVGAIDSQRQQGNLSSALRLFVLEYYRSETPVIEEHYDGLHEIRPAPGLLI
jgi:predicted DNA-binding ribbon-helix-helix protein